MSKNNRRAFITGSGAALLNSMSISPSWLSSPQTRTATLTTDKAYDPSQIRLIPINTMTSTNTSTKIKLFKNV